MKNRLKNVSKIIRFFTLIILALIAFISMTPRVEAQQFLFTFAGTTTSSSIWNLSLVINATIIAGDHYDADSYDAASTFSINGADQGTVTLAAPTFNGQTINNTFFAAGGGSGPYGIFSHDASSAADGLGWSANGTDYFISREDFFASGNNLIAGTSTFGEGIIDPESGTGVFSSNPAINPVPGPLAGAGILSYLAVLLIGLAWRGKWLISMARVWLVQPGGSRRAAPLPRIAPVRRKVR